MNRSALALVLLCGCLVRPDLRDERIDALTCDETEGTLWYLDEDGDGYGQSGETQTACKAPEGFAAKAGDCNDADNTIHPAVEEICDAIDNDCNGTVDGPESVDAQTWYVDADGDGAGNPDESRRRCNGPPGPAWVLNDSDCADDNPLLSPFLPELCDGLDNDCDGDVDEGDALDAQIFFEDADGDGYGDPLAPYPACDPTPGYVLDDTDCDDGNPDINPDGEDITLQDRDCDGLSATLSVADAELYGRPGDRVGYSLEAIGDVNADGYADFAAGAPGSDPIYQLGLTTIVYGGAPLSGNALVFSGGVWSGENPGDDAGMEVAGGGDVDGDGIDDVLMCSPQASNGRGSVYLVLGSMGMGGGSLLEVSEFKGVPGSRLGVSADIGDVTGDGLADVLVGADRSGDNGSDSGAVWVVPGAFSFPGDVDIATVGFSLTGPVEGRAGASVAFAGDLDGDGIGDFAVGAADAAFDSGATFVISGSAGLGPGTLAGTGAMLYGLIGDRVGESTSGAGDVDGDGYDDLLVGAPGSSNGDGHGYLLFGQAGGLSNGEVAVLADTTFTGLGGRSLGSSAGAAGDVDGDGLDDLLFGAPGGTYGEAWLQLGDTSMPSSVDRYTVSVVIEGELEGDGAGSVVTGLGDLDGDGYGEIGIGASSHLHLGDANSGAVYVLFGLPL